MKVIYSLIFLLGVFSIAKPQEQQEFKLKFYATNWGMSDNWDKYCEKVKEAGYDGLETWLPNKEAEQQEMLSALKKHGLSLGLLSGGGGGLFDQYYESFIENVQRAADFTPDYINCHTGKEYYTFEENSRLIAAAEEISRKHDIPIYHETHRGRFSFAAHVTSDYLKAIPYLNLTLDISHWCNVHESMLADQKETVALALSRTSHIHARVGHPQGPQVSDPSVPEWKSILDQHLAWWDEIIRIQKAKGETQMTITPEFGPPGYMPTLPYTEQPVANQWAANLYMMKLLKAKYQ